MGGIKCDIKGAVKSASKEGSTHETEKWLVLGYAMASLSPSILCEIYTYNIRCCAGYIAQLIGIKLVKH